MTAVRPELAIDLFTDDAIRDPYPLYREIRERAPAVWLPAHFDVTRDSRDQLAYGHGVHRCAGGHLAQFELEALLRALVARVRRIEVGEPRVLMSNMLRGLESFRAALS